MIEMVENTPPYMLVMEYQLLRDISGRSGDPSVCLYRASSSFWEVAAKGLLGTDTLIKIIKCAVLDTSLTLGEISSALTASLYRAQQRSGRRMFTSLELPSADGYWIRYGPDHPLADGRGWVLRHRAVLYDSLGPGEHSCQVCGWVLPWRCGSWACCINVDHMNELKGDDRVENLRVLCGWCNVNRGRFEDDSVDEWRSVVETYAEIEPWKRPFPQVA